MMPVALDIDGMTASLDLAAGTWQVRAEEAVYNLRPWAWGERRRLVAAASQGGQFDDKAFLTGLVELLYDPAPPRALIPLFALAALRLMGVPEDGAAQPLSEAERALAAHFGWLPGALEGERAGDLDRLLAETACPPPRSPPPGPGWTSIRFDPPSGGDSS